MVDPDQDVRPVSDVEMSETCRCGASTTIKGLDRRDATDTVASWRTNHRCLDGGAGPKDPQPGGASSVVLGFAASEMNHNPMGRNRRGVV